MTHPPAPAFTVVRLREGYNLSEVDEFLVTTLRELSGPLPDRELAQRISKSRFKPTRIRPGYDMSEVDDYLDVLHEWALTGQRPG